MNEKELNQLALPHQEDKKFIYRAVEFCQQAGGNDAVLLLVGSLAAGFNDSWSDLDLWILGDISCLSDTERHKYENEEQLFVDRGDYEAHWTFYDMDDFVAKLSSWEYDVEMWIFSTSRVLHGSADKIEAVKTQFNSYPEAVAEQKMKWYFGKYWSSLGPLSMAARGMPISSVIAAGQVIECLCKICCLAEKKPFPYMKWLVRVARETYLGAIIYPFLKRAIQGIEEFVNPPQDKHFRELIPLKELRATKEIMQNGLRDLGWDCDWINNPGKAVAEIMKHPHSYSLY